MTHPVVCWCCFQIFEIRGSFWWFITC